MLIYKQWLMILANFQQIYTLIFPHQKMKKEKFLYKYLNTPKNIESGIILYRNAFSISSYEGRKDWLGLGKRSRKSLRQLLIQQVHGV